MTEFRVFYWAAGYITTRIVADLAITNCFIDRLM